MHKSDISLGGRALTIETGKWAKQADGSVIVRMGDTMVLVTACHAGSPREGIDFLPLTVDYREYAYYSDRAEQQAAGEAVRHVQQIEHAGGFKQPLPAERDQV